MARTTRLAVTRMANSRVHVRRQLTIYMRKDKARRAPEAQALLSVRPAAQMLQALRAHLQLINSEQLPEYSPAILRLR